MSSVILLILMILDLMSYLIIGAVVLRWFIVFEVVNGYNPVVASLMAMFDRLTDPLLNFVRRWIPAIEGLDISPLVALIGLWFIGNLIEEYTATALRYSP